MIVFLNNQEPISYQELQKMKEAIESIMRIREINNSSEQQQKSALNSQRKIFSKILNVKESGADEVFKDIVIIPNPIFNPIY